MCHNEVCKKPKANKLCDQQNATNKDKNQQQKGSISKGAYEKLSEKNFGLAHSSY